MRSFIEENYNTTFLPNARITDPEEQQIFKNDILDGLDKINNLKNKYAGRNAIVMGLGPSLLELDKNKHSADLKITCNEFWKVPNFFEDFKPDFWCAANSYEALKVSFERCLEADIKTFVTIPIRVEFLQLLKIAREKSKTDLVYPWLWEQQMFQTLLAQKYGFSKIYSRCNTVTNHMIAFALWLGCKSIFVTGFDMSFCSALKETGMTHAGFNDDQQAQAPDAFDSIGERKQIINDLKYLCKIAYQNDIKIHNLSYKQNKLPYTLSYRKE